MAPVGADGVQQVPIYVEGVGSGRGVTWLSRTSDKILGGALGWGLMQNVVEAYKHLVFMHEPSDEIYIFGFSRGAYTARSLTGFIRCTGIVDRDMLHKLPEAIARYKKRDDPTTHPNSQESHTFRANLSLRVVTSEREAAFRADALMPPAPRVNIAYLGVWDTVGALGVPGHLTVAPLLNGRKHEFHDADLSSLVRSARHAIALDEQRPSFAPTRWDNVDELNEARSGDDLTDARRRDDLTDARLRDDAPYQERFFAGDHGSVGGGGDIHDLSSITLEWVARGAEAAGLALDPERMESVRAAQNPNGPLHNFREQKFSLMRLRKKDRTGPSKVEEVHNAVHQRWAMEGKSAGFQPYRPGSLKSLEPDLMAFHAAARDSGTAFV